MDRSGDWRRLCALLDDDESVWEAVSTALESGEDPWEALLDGLDEAGALAFLRSDDTGMELSDALAQLTRVFELQPNLDKVTDTDDLGEATAAADAVLATRGFRLVRFVEADDESWPLVVVPAGHVDEVQRCVQRLDGRIVLLD